MLDVNVLLRYIHGQNNTLVNNIKLGNVLETVVEASVEDPLSAGGLSSIVLGKMLTINVRP